MPLRYSVDEKYTISEHVRLIHDLHAHYFDSAIACHDTLHEIWVDVKEEVSGSLMIYIIWWFIHTSILAVLRFISNQDFTFSYKYSNAKLTRKVLRFFPERFAIKVIVIEKANDIDTMIIGPLQTFKMNLNEIKKSKGKSEKNITLYVASSVATGIRRKRKTSNSIRAEGMDTSKLSVPIHSREEEIPFCDFNYVAFTLKIVIAVATDLDNCNDSEAKSVEDFMETYKRLLNKWGMQDK
ncbi:hypothetical protein Gotur_029553 [Gossypium turneri]